MVLTIPHKQSFSILKWLENHPSYGLIFSENMGMMGSVWVPPNHPVLKPVGLGWFWLPPPSFLWVCLKMGDTPFLLLFHRGNDDQLGGFRNVSEYPFFRHTHIVSCQHGLVFNEARTGDWSLRRSNAPLGVSICTSPRTDSTLGPKWLYGQDPRALVFKADW